MNFFIPMFMLAVGSTDLSALPDHNVLHGIRAVDVLIENMDDSALQVGFSPSEYRHVIESRLREAGIRIARASDPDQSTTPSLYLRVATIVDSEAHAAFYSVDLELLDGVTLERSPDTFTLGSVWQARGTMGQLGTSRIDRVRGDVRSTVDQFVTAWAAANPR